MTHGGAGPGDGRNSLLIEPKEHTRRPERCALGKRARADFQTCPEREICKALTGEYDPVTRAMISPPVRIAEHPGIECIIIRRLDEDASRGREQFTYLAQYRERVLDVLDQVQQEDEVEPLIGLKFFDPSAKIFVPTRTGMRGCVRVDVHDLRECDPRFNLSQHVELPTRPPSDVECIEGFTGERLEDLPEEAAIQKLLYRIDEPRLLLDERIIIGGIDLREPVTRNRIDEEHPACVAPVQREHVIGGLVFQILRGRPDFRIGRPA